MNIKTLFLVCFALTFFNVATFGQAKDKISKIVIDAGHGGSNVKLSSLLNSIASLFFQEKLQIRQIFFQNYQ